MKVGVIGAGYWGKKHVEEYTALGHQVIVADMLDKNIEFCKEKFNTQTTKDYNDILNDSSIQAISICTPNETHHKISLDCLKAGKNLLVEKPLAMSVEEGTEIIEATAKQNVVRTVGHVFRFNNVIRKIKSIIENNELGNLCLVKLQWTNVEYDDFPDFHERYKERDIVTDLALHPLDILNYIFKKSPNEFSCYGDRYVKEKGEDAIFVNCKLDKITVNMELSWITPPKTRSIMLVGEDKTLIADCLNQKLQIYSKKNFTETNVERNNTIKEELENFLSSIHGNHKPIAGGGIGLDALKMIEACHSSMKEKRIITI
jgi:predicted dehydrogenase